MKWTRTLCALAVGAHCAIHPQAALAQDSQMWGNIFDGLKKLPGLTVLLTGDDPTDPPPAKGAPPGQAAGAGGQKVAETIDKETLKKTVEALASEEMEGRAPLSDGSKIARELIIKRIKEYGLGPAGENGEFTQEVKKKLFGNVIGNNVIAVLKGKKNPDEYVYVDAHYDHWGKAGGKVQPGANDNASGVAVMLELARLLSKQDLDRSVVFLASDYEEGAAFPMAGGLKGAAYQCDHPYCSKDKIKAVLVMDMLGGSFIDGVKPRLFLLGSESSQATYDLVKSLAKAKDRPVPLTQVGIYAIEPAGPMIARGDYGPFRGIEVPFVFATSGIPAEYHTEADTVDKVDFDFMEKEGAELLELVRKMSSADFNPTFAEDTDQVLDWDVELAALDDLVDAVSALTNLPEDKAASVEKLKKGREFLRKNLPNYSPENKKTAIRRTISNSVLTIMKMNGALKLWEHIYRHH